MSCSTASHAVEKLTIVQGGKVNKDLSEISYNVATCSSKTQLPPIIDEKTQGKANNFEYDVFSINNDHLLSSLCETENFDLVEGDYNVTKTPTDCYPRSLLDTWSGRNDHNSMYLVYEPLALDLSGTYIDNSNWNWCLDNDCSIVNVSKNSNLVEGDYHVTKTPTGSYERSLLDTWSGRNDHNSTSIFNVQSNHSLSCFPFLDIYVKGNTGNRTKRSKRKSRRKSKWDNKKMSSGQKDRWKEQQIIKAKSRDTRSRSKKLPSKFYKEEEDEDEDSLNCLKHDDEKKDPTFNDQLLKPLEERENMVTVEGGYNVSKSPTNCYEHSFADTWSGCNDSNARSSLHVQSFRKKKRSGRQMSKKIDNKLSCAQKDHVKRVNLEKEQSRVVRTANAEMMIHLYEEELRTRSRALNDLKTKLSSKDPTKYTYKENVAICNASLMVNKARDKLGRMVDYKEKHMLHRFPRQRKCVEKDNFNHEPKYNTRTRNNKSICYKERTGSTSSTDVESDDEDKDPTFDINKHQKVSKIKMSKQKKRKSNISSVYGTTRNNKFDIMPVQEEYVNVNALSSSETEEDCMDHKWVYDLKALDHNKEPFARKALVIVRGDSKKLISKCWQQLCGSKLLTRASIEKILILPRCIYGQIYLCQGLQQSLHFSLGQAAIKEINEKMHSMGIPVNVYECNEINKDFEGTVTCTEYSKFQRDGLFVRNMSQYKETTSLMSNTLDEQLKNHMCNMGKDLWYNLFLVSSLLYYFVDF